MSYYFEGLSKAKEAVYKMNKEGLLQHIDGLYGRCGLPKDCAFHDLQHEAIMQTKKDFTDTSSKEYKDTQFHIKMAKLLIKKPV